MFSVLEDERVTTLLHALSRRVLKLWQWPVVLGGSTLYAPVSKDSFIVPLQRTHRSCPLHLTLCYEMERIWFQPAFPKCVWKTPDCGRLLRRLVPNSYLCTRPKKKKSFIRKVIAQHHSMAASPAPVPLSLWKQEVVQLLLEGLRPYSLVLLGRVMVCVSVFMVEGGGRERENAKIYSAKGCKWTKCSNYEEGFMFACL